MASSLSLVAVPGPRNSVSLAEFNSCQQEIEEVQYYARAFGELEIWYVWQRQIQIKIVPVERLGWLANYAGQSHNV